MLIVPRVLNFFVALHVCRRQSDKAAIVKAKKVQVVVDRPGATHRDEHFSSLRRPLSSPRHRHLAREDMENAIMRW